MPSKAQSILLLIIAAIAAAGGFYGARLTAATPAESDAEPTEQTQVIPVKTANARSGELAELATAFGVVQSRAADAVSLSVPFESVTKAVHVSAGDSVAAGDVLVDVEPSPEAVLQLRQAEQALAAAERLADQARRRRDDRLATNADVVAAEQAGQTAKTQVDALRARGIGEPRTLNAAKAGVVTAVSAQAGQLVAAGSPLLVLLPADGTEVRLSIDPADADALRRGDAVMIHVPNSPNTLAGTVRQQSHTINPQSRLSDVFVRPNSDGGLRIGAFVDTEFKRRTVNGLIVPRAATQLEDDEWCVYVIKNNKAVRHVVTLGPSDGKEIVVSGDGLADGDAVVVERNGELRDSVVVKAEPADEDEK